VDDLLLAVVQEISTVPASPTGEVAAINVTPNFMGSGRTRVQFVMITRCRRATAATCVINVRFSQRPRRPTHRGQQHGGRHQLGASPAVHHTAVNVTAVATGQQLTGAALRGR